MNLREIYEKETGRSWADIGTDGVHLLPNITVPSFEYVKWLESLLEWIPCSERLPEEDGRCLIIYSRIIKGELGRSRIYVADYDTFKSKWVNLFNGVEVTHWLPLQPLPEDV